MNQGAKTYYISLGTGEISQSKTASTWQFEISATDEEIIQLREYFDQLHSTEIQGFFRAHVPYVEYHWDRTNDVYDDTMLKVFDLISQTGNEEAKQQVETMKQQYGNRNQM